MPERIRLVDTACRRCTFSVVVELSPIATVRDHRPQWWDCPWCEAENYGDYPGPVADVRKAPEGRNLAIAAR